MHASRFTVASALSTSATPRRARTSTTSRASINGYGASWSARVARVVAVTDERAIAGRGRGVLGVSLDSTPSSASASASSRRAVVRRDVRSSGTARIVGDVARERDDDRARWRDARVKAVAGGASSSDDASASDDFGSKDEDETAKRVTPQSLLLTLVRRLVKPLQDFGFGRTRLWEGGVGLFIISGVALTFIIWGWIQGLLSFARKNSYQAFIEFPVACGIQVGTNVRIRGVKAGSVLSVQPSLEKVEVLVEMDDKNVPIPRNSLIEANQSGLIAETIIDITPTLPIPNAQWGPLDSGCEGEGLIVCDRGKIKGQQGVSMDELVGICTKLAREMERQNGVAQMFATTESAQRLMTTLQPLLREAAQIAQELRPMMQNVNEQGTLDTLETLAGKTSATVEDIRKLKATILTEENQELLRQSISTLTKTLQHIEKVSGDISSVSGDPSTRTNLRHLIQSLSRLVDA